MNDLAKFVFFIAATIGALVAAEKMLGCELFDDADAHTNPYRHVTP